MTSATESSVASLASRGKFPLRSTTHIADCTFEKQRLILSVAVKGIATKELLKPVLISLPQERHNTPPNGSHAFAKEITGGSLFHLIVRFWGHYPSTCMAHVKLKTKTLSQHGTCAIFVQDWLFRLPQTSNQGSFQKPRAKAPIPVDSQNCRRRRRGSRRSLLVGA